jgi:hypothetical protein
MHKKGAITHVEIIVKLKIARNAKIVKIAFYAKIILLL